MLRHLVHRGIIVASTALVMTIMLCQAFLATQYHSESKELSALAHHIANPHPGAPASETIRKLLYFTHRVGGHRGHEPYFHPLFEFLRPRPKATLDLGGTCADKSRLFIVLARHLGIDAHKLAIYNHHGQPFHAMVHVQSERGWYVVDPNWDLLYDTSTGHPIPLETMMSHPETALAALDRKSSAGHQSATKYPAHETDYSAIRTINWDKSHSTLAIYEFGVSLFGKKFVHSIPRPFFVEEPLLMLIILGGMLQGSLALLVLALTISSPTPTHSRKIRLKPNNTTLSTKTGAVDV